MRKFWDLAFCAGLESAYVLFSKGCFRSSGTGSVDQTEAAAWAAAMADAALVEYRKRWATPAGEG